MTSRHRIPAKLISFCGAIFLILFVSICFGQLLGGYYLKNIHSDQLSFEGGGGHRTKALRLNKFDYYSIVVGTYDSREQALSVGSALAQEGLPVVISAAPPYRVLLGFANKADNLLTLASRIQVDGQKAAVRKGEVNNISFRFKAGDSFAEKEIAPYLGRISVCLNKGLLLYTGISTEDEGMRQLQPKYSVLAAELQELAQIGTSLANDKQAAASQEALLILALRCEKWALSLRLAQEEWQDTPILISQQQALALLEDYGRFIQDML